MDEPITLAQDASGIVTSKPTPDGRTRFEYRGEDGREYATELRPVGAALLSDLDPEDLLGLMEMASEGMPGEGGPSSVELADLDRELVRYEAEKAQTVDGGPLDPARVAAFARERRIPVSEAWATLSAALDGSYEGDPANLRGGPRLEAAWRRAERAGVSIGQAVADLAAGGESGPDDHLIADLADRYAQEHGVGYAEALIRVQLRHGEEG